MDKILDMSGQLIGPLRTSTWASIALLVSILFLALHQQRRPSSKNAPPCVRGLPVIGSALALLTPHKSVLKHQKALGDVFSFFLFSTKVHIVLQPSAALSVFKNKALSFREIEKWIDSSFFDYPDSMNTSEDDQEFLAMEKSVKPHLVTTNGIALMSTAYLEILVDILLKELTALQGTPSQSMEIDDFWPWVRERAYQASTKALFGALWPADESKQLYWDYEAALTELLLFPPILLGSKIKLRENLVTVIAAAIEEHGLEGCSGLMRDRLILGRGFGYSDRDLAKICIDVLFALQANATPMTFWLLAHVVGDQRLYKRVKAMVTDLPMPTRESPESEELKDLINDEWLTSVFDESLRLHAHSSIMRKCVEETQLGDFTVQAGEFVVIPTPTFHHNPRVWRDPFVFDEERFARLAAGEEGEYGPMKKEEVLIPFGGKWGLHYCPGRFFAKVEIVALALLMCKMFDVEALNGLPEGWIFGKYGNGTQQPVEKMRVRLSIPNQ